MDNDKHMKENLSILSNNFLFVKLCYTLNISIVLDPDESSRVCDRIWKPEALKLECSGQPRYFYEKGKCQTFTYRGGLGTKNNFPSSSACEKMCKCKYCC